MRYILTRCGSCGRPRIVDASKSSSSCPYCGTTSDNSRLPVLFASDSQKEVREALSRSVGFDAPDLEGKKEKIAATDPYSTLARRYERCSDPATKMSILAEGLTELKGDFTMEDVRGFAGDKAEKMVAAMLERCLIAEVRIGVYRA